VGVGGRARNGGAGGAEMAQGVPPGEMVGGSHTLPSMHGMVSAGVLIAVFSLTTVAALYVAVRIHLAGGRPGARARAAVAATAEEPWEES
jgi:hypothetical protein